MIKKVLKDVKKKSMLKIFLYTIAFLIGLLSLLLTTRNLTQKEAFKEIQTESINKLNLNEAFIKTKINSFFTNSLMLVNDHTIDGFIEKNKNAESVDFINKYLKKHCGLIDATIVYILNNNGITIASSNYDTQESFIGHNYSFRPYFQKAMKGETANYVALGVTTKNLGYFISQPIIKEGKIEAVLVIKYNLDFLKKVAGFANENILITDENGIVFYSTDNRFTYHYISGISESIFRKIKSEQQYGDKELLRLPVVKNANEGGFDILFAPATTSNNSHKGGIIEQKKYITIFKTIESNGWNICLLTDYSRIDSNIVKNLLYALFAYFALIFVIFFLSQRRAFSIKIRESEERFRILTEKSLVGVYLYENDKFTYVNPCFAEMLGYTQNEIINKFSVEDIVDSSVLDKVKNAIDQRLTNKTTSLNYIVKMLTKDGRLIDVEVFGSKMGIDHSTGIIGTALNVTDRIRTEKEREFLIKELEASKDSFEQETEKVKLLNKSLLVSGQRLKESNLTKDKFFTIIAHDLRSPLGSFKTMTEFMMSESLTLSADERKEMLDVMRRTAVTVFSLLENLLLWARSQKGSLEYNPVINNSATVIKNALPILTATAKNKNVEINIDNTFSSDIYCDEKMITTILRNIVSNSLKFTNPGGYVEVAVRDYSQSEVLFSIKDTGIGMDEHTKENLFKIDVKTSNIGTDGERGSGLGLLICKEFVEKYSGKIWVDSVEDEGSTFYFTVPKISEHVKYLVNS